MAAVSSKLPVSLHNGRGGERTSEAKEALFRELSDELSGLGGLIPAWTMSWRS
ncbi:Hypothetical protein FKW44_011573 [Caligus rogercresseyi]|uniref:Uncharacterized protein n=1 Tax=Caligus rogercresseyi TaxID=217165 RepID=A0A7T8HIJ1_CALRO|nr:Hypothetical protein FKW44_011573 [Caligus rogercresseyi]